MAALEKQRQEEERRLDEERRNLEVEKRKVEEAQLAELKRQRQEEEAKQLALEKQRRKAEEAAKAMVTIVVFRLSKFVGSLLNVPLLLNDTYIGTLTNGSFLIYATLPGKQTILPNSDYPGSNIGETFEFEPGQTYYILTKLSLGNMTLLTGTGGTITLQHVTEVEGREAIKGLKNVGKINPADVLNDYDETEAN